MNSLEKAKELYSQKSLTKEWRQCLEEVFGKENLCPPDVTDRIKTVKDAYWSIGIGYDFRQVLARTEDDYAFVDLKRITEALNEDWVADFNDMHQMKYYPRFYVDASGTFLLYDVGYTYTGLDVGARLFLKTRDLARYAGSQFIDIYRIFLLGK